MAMLVITRSGIYHSHHLLRRAGASPMGDGANEPAKTCASMPKTELLPPSRANLTDFFLWSLVVKKNHSWFLYLFIYLINNYIYIYSLFFIYNKSILYICIILNHFIHIYPICPNKDQLRQFVEEIIMVNVRGIRRRLHFSGEWISMNYHLVMTNIAMENLL